ncbi:hypothetical protein CBR_g4881 [Chara braunii]|uniref:Integrase catalytic domain-containing protein n=1 Tax=Chara braunii TaxID=69332 RepID=A0A388KJA6_CHABU|nr:hypothetical protein CBR_g4881 [Chara braunii]|eukprot:GBG70053.1 hypothetical protein CBR_g4881 [Chara braunii]
MASAADWKLQMDAAPEAEKTQYQFFYEKALKKEEEEKERERRDKVQAHEAVLSTLSALTDEEVGEKTVPLLRALAGVRVAEDHTDQLAQVFKQLKELREDMARMAQQHRDQLQQFASSQQAQIVSSLTYLASYAACQSSFAPLTTSTSSASTSSSSLSVVNSQSEPAASPDPAAAAAAAASGGAGTSGTVAAPGPDPAMAGPGDNFAYINRKAAQIPSKYDGKDDVESWISSMRSYFDVLGTPPSTHSSILGTNVEPVVRGFLETQAVQSGYKRIDLNIWLKATPTAALEDLLIKQYVDPHVAAKARLNLDKLKHSKWTGTMHSLQQYVSKLFATPDLEMTAQSCLDVIKGTVPSTLKDRLGLGLSGYTDWLTLMRDLVKLEAQDLPGGSGGKKATSRKRFPCINRFAAHDLLEDDEETLVDESSLDDDQEQDCGASCSLSAHDLSFPNGSTSNPVILVAPMTSDMLSPESGDPPPEVPPEIRDLLNRFSEVLAKPHGVPVRPVRHKIELTEGSTPPKGCVYRMGFGELEELRRQIDEMIGKGWIKPNESEFGAPVLFVPKKGGKLRMCIDYRGLNRITRKNAYPLPHIDDLLDAAGGCKVFSKIDLKSGYHQIEVEPADQHKTAFKTRDGLYEFTVMPFGLTNAPATFQSLMDKVFRNQINRFVVVYLNDILIFSKSMEEHMRHLEEVMQVLKDAQLHLNLEKSEFGRDSVIYLGHWLSAAGLEPEATKVEVIRNWPQPANVHELRSFLGLASYYRKFVPKFSITARPLSRLTSKNVSYTWDGECTTTFAALKEALIKHKKDCYNRVADALSRHPEYMTCLVGSYDLRKDLKEELIEHTVKDPELSPILEQIRAEPSSQPDFHECKGLLFRRYGKHDRLCVPNHEPIMTHFLDLAHGRSGHFGVEKTYENLLEKFVWPGMKSMTQRFVAECEVCQSIKPSRQKPYGLLHPLPIPDGPGESVSIDFTDMGKKSRNGYSQVMVIVDRFSKFFNLIPLPPHAPTDLVIEEFNKRYILQCGPPKTLVSDRDTRFISADWNFFTSQTYDMKLKMTSGRHPEANGLAEEINQTVIQLLRALTVLDQNSWDDELPIVQGLYNNFIHSSTRMTPNRLHLGWKIRNPLSYLFPEQPPGLTPGQPGYSAKYDRLLKVVVAAMERRRSAMIKHANKKRQPDPFTMGSYVWVKMSEFSDEKGVSRKLLPQYYGP